MNGIFLTILNMSLTGAFVIVAVCLARLLLKRAPKYISYLLWIVVGFRLLVPFSIESTFSLIPFNATEAIPQITQTNVQQPSNVIQQQYTPGDTITTSPSYNESNITTNPTEESTTSPINPIPPSQSQAMPQSAIQWWPNVVAWLWLLGMFIMIAYGTISYYMLHLKMEKAGLIARNIYRANNIASPFVLGFIKPKIFLPPYLKANEREYILLHEQTHIGRKDHIVKLLAYFILCIHWFNPLAWVAFLAMEKDMEMSCDEGVLRQLGGRIKKDYSLTLLSLATERRALITSPLAFGESGTKERVKNVLSYKRISRIAAVLIIVLVLALSIGLAMNRASGYQPTIAPEYTPEPEQNEPYQGNEPEYNQPEETSSAQYIYANLIMDSITNDINDFPYVTVVERRIDTLEYRATIENVMENPIEMWYFAFSLRVEEEEGARWGTFTPDQDGWLCSRYSGLHDLSTTMVFSVDGEYGQFDGLNYIGVIHWWLDGGDDTLWSSEVALRAYLENAGIIPPISFPGNHYLAYFGFGQEDFMRNRLLLSQPFGEDGIWVVERWQQLNGNLHHNMIPKSDTLSMFDYFLQQQRLFEEGHAPWLADPFTVARAYIDFHEGWQNSPITDIYPVPAGADPLYLPDQNRSIPMHIRHAGALTGPIIIIGNTLYLDEVEVIFDSDTQRVAELWPETGWTEPKPFYIRHINVELVWPGDTARREELGLTQEDFPNDWDPVYHFQGIEPLSFTITPNTIFEFADTGMALPDTQEEGSRLRITGLNDFLLARPELQDYSMVGTPTFRRIAYFVQVNERGEVVSVVEEFMLTQ